jgi:hypothetical protein
MQKELERLLNSFLQNSAIYHNAENSKLMMQWTIEQHSTDRLLAKNTEYIFKRIRDEFKGYNESEGEEKNGIIDICKRYYSRYPQELNEKEIKDVLDFIIKRYNGYKENTILSERQHYSKLHLSEDQQKTIIIEMTSAFNSIITKYLFEIGSELKLILKDQEYRKAEIDKLKNETIAYQKSANRDKIWTRVIAILAIISTLIGITIQYYFSNKSFILKNINDNNAIRKTSENNKY